MIEKDEVLKMASGLSLSPDTVEKDLHLLQNPTTARPRCKQAQMKSK